MPYQTDKRPHLGCAALALVLSIIFVVLSPIGPIFVYGWLVPVIDPLIPRPDDVPWRAEAVYNWKGSGLVWYWEDEVEDGCARWWAANHLDEPVRGLTVFEGGENCDDGERVMDRSSTDQHTTFGSVAHEWPYKNCSFVLSGATISRHLAQVTQLKNAIETSAQKNLLDEMYAEIRQVELQGLEARQYGCALAQDKTKSVSSNTPEPTKSIGSER
jgi:hypothetical protein